MTGPSARVVFWDFDGTLATRPDHWSGTLVEALAAVDQEFVVSVDAMRPHVAGRFPWHSAERVTPPLSADEWWTKLTPVFTRAYAAVGVPDDTARRAVKRIPHAYYRPDAWRIADDAATALAITSADGYRNVILSNHAPELPTLIERLGLSAWFDLTITSASVGAEKPDRFIFDFAREAAGAGPDCWMIGDNPVADVEGAEAAGIRAILVGSGTTLTDAANQVTAAQAKMGVVVR